MKVSQFMKSIDDVVSCKPDDTLRDVMSTMKDNKVGAIVVLDYNEEPHLSGTTKALGILTKTDFVDAYQKQLSLETPVKMIMTQILACLKSNVGRDDAAKFFEREQKHHAIVIDNDDNFVGLISAWDVASETAKDARAWPWPRDAIPQKATTSGIGGSPTSVRLDSHSFRDYVDSLVDLPYMDD